MFLSLVRGRQLFKFVGREFAIRHSVFGVCEGFSVFADVAVELLHPSVRELIVERGWCSLTEVQRVSIPHILSGKNVLIIAPTGYGKTEAVILPLLSMMLNQGAEPVAVLYITPLRALINDLKQRIEWWASRLGFIVSRKHGDVPQRERVKRVKTVPHILLTTPESLEIDLDRAHKFRKYLKNIKWVVIDEVQELIGSKRGVQLAVLLERLKDYIGRDFQRIMLSATIGNPLKVIKFFTGSSKRNTEIIQVDIAKSFEIILDYIDEEETDNIWLETAKKIKNYIKPPTLIFVNSRYTSERLQEALERIKLNNVYVHHSSISREARAIAENKLKKGELEAVVCTKTLELGIDIGYIDRVILFRSPGQVVSLIQRIGRSGHVINGISRGVVIAVNPIEVAEVIALTRLAEKKIYEEPIIIDKPLDVAAREIIGMVMQYKEVELNRVYKVLKNSEPFSTLKINEFNELVKFMAKNQVIELNKGKLRLGPKFYRIWRFDKSDIRKLFSRNFKEFFSFIGNNSEFIVKSKDKNVGTLDASYVYRYIRVGDKIRLAGKLWRVINIDEYSGYIEVAPSLEDEEGEIPIWRGEVGKREYIVAEEISKVLNEIARRELSIPKILKLSNSQITKLLKDIVQEYEKANIPIPSSGTVLVEKSGDYYIFTALIGERVSEAIALILLHNIAKREGLGIDARASAVGFAVKAKNTDPITTLLNIDPNNLDKLARNVLSKFPQFYVKLRDIQVSFGKIGKVKEDEELLVKETIRQVLIEELDLERAKEFLRKIREGIIKIHIVKSTKPTPLAEYLMRTPPIRLWIPGLATMIAQALKDSALTVEELSEILDLPHKTIENKLKEMRKSEKYRVTYFRDIDTNEVRWVLVEDLSKIAKSEFFKSSFIPEDPTETFVLLVKLVEGDEYYHILFKPLDILKNPETLIKRLPVVNEIYELKVYTASRLFSRALFVIYYHITKDALPYIALNAVTYLQKLRRSAY